MIQFQLDTTSGVATYLQLVQQVHQAMRLELLEPGSQLPTAQQVVSQLAINPNAVLKAYRDLEREGLVGLVQVGDVRDRIPVPHQSRNSSSPARFDDAVAGWARSAGLDADDIEAIYRTAFRDSFAEGVA